MKKWTSILILICLCFSLFGCGKDEPVESSVSPSEDPQEELGDEITPEPEPVYVLIGTVYDVDTFLNIRSGPGTTYDVIGRAYANEKYTVITEFYTEKWHKVEYDGGIAYIHSDYLVVQEILVENTESGDSDSEDEGTTNNGDSNQSEDDNSSSGNI